MARILADDLWLCSDCTIAAVNDDYSGMEPARAAAVSEGIGNCGGYLVANWDSETMEGVQEFSWSRCHCCRTGLGGARHRFALLES